EGRRKKDEGRGKKEKEERRKKREDYLYINLSTVNCQLSTVNYFWFCWRNSAGVCRRGSSEFQRPLPISLAHS
ncbi:MAG: hypothetical protein HC942_19735, partial [Microcoleus sp. SU_5_6]|nr:hypothetical protein [Microcoleus sp. SU_5_6]